MIQNKNIIATAIVLTSLAISGCGGQNSSSSQESKNNEEATNSCAEAKPWDNGKLKVTSDKRMLQHEDGTPFFWMADTGWYVPNELNKSEIDTYLQNRKEKGFTVIQVTSNPLYHYNGGDLTMLDYAVNKAEELGLYIAIVPSWNGSTKTVAKAKNRARDIANRYKNKKNIIWIVGGDTDGNKAKDLGMSWSDYKSAWNAMGSEIRRIVDDRHLISFHPAGKDSYDLMGDPSWIDFHAIQTGHCATMDTANNRFKSLYSKVTNKPVIDMEPRYEGIRCLNKSGKYIDDNEVREIAYRQLFSGAFGHTYGNHAVWQFYRGGGTTDTYYGAPKNTWDKALDDPGADQMGYVANLMQSRPLIGRKPDQTIVSNGNAIATKGSRYAFVYLPDGGSVTINTSTISSNKIKAWWYNPRTGDADLIGEYSSSQKQQFNAPDTKDWVLVIDDAGLEYGVPGVDQ